MSYLILWGEEMILSPAEICAIAYGVDIPGVTPITDEVYHIDGGMILKFLSSPDPELELKITLELSDAVEQGQSDEFPLVYDSGYCDDTPYIVMDDVGRSLEEMLRADELTMPLVDIRQQVECALAFLESRGILHADLHDANVMIDDLEVRLVDFGLSSYKYKDDVRTNDITQFDGYVSESAQLGIVKSSETYPWNREKMSNNPFLSLEMVELVDTYDDAVGEWSIPIIGSNTSLPIEERANILEYLRI